MNDIRGFLRWQFAGVIRNPSFWGMTITLLALLAAVTGCPAPIPAVMLITGSVILGVDCGRMIIGAQYRMYKLEQETLVNQLKRK